MQLNSHLNTLSNDINYIIIVLRGIVWECWELKKLIIHKLFLNTDISLNILTKCLTFSLCIVHYHIEGTVSQIFYLGLSFCFMKSRKLSFKK